MISYRQATQEDFEFLWQLHRSGLKPYVERIWGWDEEWQFNRFRENFDPASQEVILYRGEVAGTLIAERREENIFLAYIAVAPAYRGQGLGTAVIQELLAKAATKKVPVILKVLKGNPAKRLYERLGFETTAQTETHDWMKKE